MSEFKHCFVMFTFGFFLSGCGGGSNDTGGTPPPVADLRPTARITAEASMDENTSLVISGSNSSDPEGAIASYSWRLENAAGLDVQISNDSEVNVSLDAGMLSEDVIVTLVLTVTDSNAQTSTARADVEIRTLEGTDADSDGVRDDVSKMLEAIYPVSDPKYAVVLKIAKNKQSALVDSDLTGNEIQQLTIETGMAGWCLSEAGEDVEGLMAQIEIAHIDNAMRREANEVIDQKFSNAGLFELPDLATVNSYCETNFDL